jgi:hypothetical protein
LVFDESDISSMEAPPTSSPSNSPPAHWLDKYGDEQISKWQKAAYNGQRVLYRPLGIVEGFFDTDGTDFEGRADVTSLLKTELATTNTTKLREKISLAWAVFRYKHPLACAKAVDLRDLQPGRQEIGQRCFVVPRIFNIEGLLHDANTNAPVGFVEDDYPDLGISEFYNHLINTSRAIDPRKALSRLYVLPMQRQCNGIYKAQFIMVKAHQICDGLTVFRWLNSFIDLLNLSNEKLDTLAEELCSTDLLLRLPPAQEALYPPVRGSTARQRWHWAISRVLRHTKRPLPACFQHPLRHGSPSKEAVSMPSTYSKVIDYSRTPPLNTYSIQATLGPSTTQKLARLCSEAKISIGAGSFTLVGMSMMYFYEQNQPNIPLNQRLPFTGSFPINPRPFLSQNTTGGEESLMLAFSDGITLPFLPSHLPIEGRFKLLGRLAHKQLSQYQKRRRTPQEFVGLGSRNPNQLIPALYLGSVERLEAKTHSQTGINPQGAYPASKATMLATCGVSSVGDRRNLIRSGRYDVHRKLEKGEVVCDYRDNQTCVRVREGEFLVGASGDGEMMRFEASCDGCAIDMERVGRWVQWIETALDGEGEARNRQARL